MIGSYASWSIGPILWPRPGSLLMMGGVDKPTRSTGFEDGFRAPAALTAPQPAAARTSNAIGAHKNNRLDE
jgi:hypothetical protein